MDSVCGRMWRAEGGGRGRGMDFEPRGGREGVGEKRRGAEEAEEDDGGRMYGCRAEERGAEGKERSREEQREQRRTIDGV